MTVIEWIGSGLLVVGVTGITYILLYVEINNDQNQNSENNEETQTL